MKIQAVIYDNHAVFSRARHDFRTFNGISVDGGPGIERIVGQLPDKTFPPVRWIEIKDVNYADLYNDWNWRQNKYGIHPLNEVIFLEEKDYPNTDSFEWKVETAIWKTWGKDGAGPGKMIMLKDAETEHLIKILETQNHIPSETKRIIEYILKQRKK